jgi:hypothetical protein
LPRASFSRKAIERRPSAGLPLAGGSDSRVGPGRVDERRLDGAVDLTSLREPFVTAQPPKRSALRAIPRNGTWPERPPPQQSLGLLHRGTAAVLPTGERSSTPVGAPDAAVPR